MKTAAVLNNLSFSYEKQKRVLGPVTLDLFSGETFGFLGPNGSGKSTLFRILSTALKPTGGEVKIGEKSWDIVRDEKQIREIIGVVFQSPSLDLKLSVYENLKFHGYFYGLSGKSLGKRCEELLTHLGLADRKKEMVGKLSGGLKRRVELARGLLHRPQILILDEPSTGLDPSARRELWGYLKRIRGEESVSILLTTHLMDEAEHCDRIAILNHGQVLSSGSPAELKKKVKKEVLEIETEKTEKLQSLLKERFQIQSRIDGRKVFAECENGAELVPKIAALFTDEMESIILRHPTLEDVFLHETGHGFKDEEIEPKKERKRG